MEWIVGLVIVVFIIGYISHLMNKKRRERLMLKYNDAQIVDAIMAKKIWVNMTEEQLVDSWGRPADIDERVLKTKVSHTYKYNQAGKNRYRDRVKLDNGIVIGWDLK